MEQFKKAKVVIKEGIDPKDSTVQFWNLYIISDDEIKEGDWVVYKNKMIYQNSYGEIGSVIGDEDFIRKYCKKIIATTDESLNLPQPSDSFIKKYVEGYNKGNVITDVLVEYNIYDDQCDGLSCGICNCNHTTEKLISELKINPKDNTITIKKVKDSYTREEHISNIKKFSLELGSKIHCFLKEDGTLSISIQDVNKWIEENL